MKTLTIVLDPLIPSQLNVCPWMVYAAELKRYGVHIEVARPAKGFSEPHDAMMLYVWLDFHNSTYFNPFRILPIMEAYSVYRSKYPDVPQILCNHTDMSRRPYILPYWRSGDVVMYRTPPYDRSKLHPLPPKNVWGYEKVMGAPVFKSEIKPIYRAGFIGTPTGPKTYRERVAKETARVGVGICATDPMPQAQYQELMQQCEIIVCPRGWGEQSMRHWDAWKSGKPVLTDRDCDSVELIPGIRLQAGVHYLVYDDPAEIPDIVNDYTKPGRRDDLDQIAANGRLAVEKYQPLDGMLNCLRSIWPGLCEVS